MYNANSVVIDGVTVIKKGMVCLPMEVSRSNITEKEIQLILLQEGLELTLDEALLCFESPVVYLPLKSKVIEWVVDKSNEFISYWNRQGNGEEYIIRAYERRKKFIDDFDTRYDEKRLFELLTKCGKYKLGNRDKQLGAQFAEKDVIYEVARILLTIRTMTEYKLEGCYEIKKE